MRSEKDVFQIRERVGGSVVIIFEVLTLSWNGGQALMGGRPLLCYISLSSPVHALWWGSSPTTDSGEGRPLCFPHHRKELSRQLYSTLIIQATRQETLCILFCWGCIINADIHQMDEGILCYDVKNSGATTGQICEQDNWAQRTIKNKVSRVVEILLFQRKRNILSPAGLWDVFCNSSWIIFLRHLLIIYFSFILLIIFLLPVS